MSTAKQLADEEAERMERELADTGDEHEHSEPGVIDLDALSADGPTEAQAAAMAEENERHLDTLRTIMGPAAGLFDVCKHCDGAGLAPRGPEPVQYERYRQCPTCVGFGSVLTGAQETAQAAVACPSCGGRGFQEKVSEQQPPVAPQVPAGGQEEEWGVPSWMGDPHITPQTPPPLPTV